MSDRAGTANNPAFSARIREMVGALSRKTCYHSLELNDGTVLPGLIGIEALRARIQSFPIPGDLRGRRVLDVGAASGWNSFEMERRGAEVVAVDCVDYSELATVRDLLGSRVDYRLLDMDELDAERVGTFDFVLFFGVFYHLRHPLLGLEKICALTRDSAFVESFVVDAGQRSDACTLEFYEIDELGGQIDNWFGPTTACLMAMCRSAGFARVDLEYINDRRAGLTCRRRWEEPPANPTCEAPWLCSAVNNRTSDVYFHFSKDEYICMYFRSREEITKNHLRAEVDELGAPVLSVAKIGDGEWQANLRVPPGLTAGTHEIRLRTLNSGFSNGFSFVVIPGNDPVSSLPVFPPVEAASDPGPSLVAVGSTFDRSAVFHGYRNEYLHVRFLSGETNLSRDSVLLEIDGRPEPIQLVTRLSATEWQVNAKLPRNIGAGSHSARVRTLRSGYSESGNFIFQPQ
jgi:tRNA (mo5U34)-methyltransferase